MPDTEKNIVLECPPDIYKVGPWIYPIRKCHFGFKQIQYEQENMQRASIEARLLPPELLPNITDDQLIKLEESFQRNRNPDPTDVMLVAAEVGLTETETQRWFVHRLAVWRKQQGLPAHSRHVTD